MFFPDLPVFLENRRKLTLFFIRYLLFRSGGNFYNKMEKFI